MSEKELAAEEQAVPTGYKQTEVGVIPEDWEVVPFGSLLESKSTQRKKLVEDEEVSFVGMQDVSESAKLIQIHQLAYSKIKSGLTYFERGDVLVAKITPCFENGKGCHTDELKTEVGFGSTEFHVLKANQRADSWFIYFWTTQADFRMKLESEMVGSAGHRRVPLSAITAFTIPAPSCREEQIAIANTLSDVDALISSLDALIAKTQAIKTATMQQLLSGRTRLPQFATHPDGSPKGYKTSELGEIPEDWEVLEIGQFAPLQRGFDLPSTIRKDGKYPVVYSNGIVNTHCEYQVKGPGVVTGRSGTLGKVHFVDSDYWPHNTSLWVTKFDKADPKFIYFLFTHISFERFASGSGVPTLNRNDAHCFKVALPLTEEQTAIATVLSDMDKEIQALEQRLTKTRDLKQGMMQQLLTGKIRLPVEEDR